MRVLIINTSERIGGAAIAANRLMENKSTCVTTANHSRSDIVFTFVLNLH